MPRESFQFLGIPPKGERSVPEGEARVDHAFPISRDPPEGGTINLGTTPHLDPKEGFPISRDPPEGGT